VICEEKHMGSCAILLVCSNEESARKRFGIVGGESGICYTRTGRRFFDDPGLESQLLARIRAALDAIGFWESFKTDWACLDAELMPWSAKAQELLRRQYAPVGSAGLAATKEAMLLLEAARQNGVTVQQIAQTFGERAQLVGQFVKAYRQYCWPVNSLEDLKLAPFHLLATEAAVHTDKDHEWHMQQLGKVCAADPKLLHATPYRIVDLTKIDETDAAIRWWTDLTARGGEGMVVKPLQFIEKGRRGIVQPAVKCRGKEYLRIIYGPDYTMPENLTRLRSRGLSGKRSLALREFALGVEGLERFVRKEPLRRVHECVFGVLALESEPVDPRL
jgi:protein phosphatase